MTNISVIIPSNHGHHELLKVVHAICNQTFKPDEIVIVDSSTEHSVCSAEITAFCAVSGIGLNYEHHSQAFPGHARNIGLGMAKSELIAFIDVKTIPRPHWLEAASNLLASNEIDCVWGATCFSAETTFERLVRDGFHGTLARTTLPGTVCRRDVFAKAGQFVGWVRAGEDTEWMLRLKLLKLPVINPSSSLIDYVGLIGSDTKRLLSKWYRNYMASSDLPHFFPQRLLLWLVFYPVIIVIAFNWNYLIAEWRMDSPLYIGHITKIVAGLPVLAYVVVRGLALPMQRGVGIWRLLPFRFIPITVICFMADIVKVLVFSVPKRKRDASTLKTES
jgi:glycosyltransferase involved in cell wall biosynthesis